MGDSFRSLDWHSSFHWPRCTTSHYTGFHLIVWFPSTREWCLVSPHDWRTWWETRAIVRQIYKCDPEDPMTPAAQPGSVTRATWYVLKLTHSHPNLKVPWLCVWSRESGCGWPPDWHCICGASEAAWLGSTWLWVLSLPTATIPTVNLSSPLLHTVFPRWFTAS